MKFENKGKWLKEAEEEKLVFDNREQADFLDGDDKVLTMEDDEELSGELLDEVESDEMEDLEPIEEEDDVLDSPEDEEDAIVMAEDFRPDDTVPQSKQMDFKKQYMKNKDRRKVAFYFDGIHAVDDQSGSDIPGAVLGMKYKDLAAALDKFFESAQKNEDNASELKKELDQLYKGIGWAEWDYFKEGLAYSTNFKPNGMSDSDLEKMINASGIAKVKKVKEIKNFSSMEDFDPKDFRLDDKIIVTKKPMSSQFHGESAQKNEAKLDKGYDINFDKLGCGFEVVSGAITNGYGLYCSGYSNNTSKNLMFSHKDLSMDKGLTQDERKEHYDRLQQARTAIAKDLKPLADKFDKDVEAVFAKHGFKPYKD